MEAHITRILVEPLALFAANMRFLGAGLAVIGIAGAALGIGKLFSSHITGISCNPASEKRTLPITMLGFALTEAAGLFALLISFLILFT